MNRSWSGPGPASTTWSLHVDDGVLTLKADNAPDALERQIGPLLRIERHRLRWTLSFDEQGGRAVGRVRWRDVSGIRLAIAMAPIRRRCRRGRVFVQAKTEGYGYGARTYNKLGNGKTVSENSYVYAPDDLYVTDGWIQTCQDRGVFSDLCATSKEYDR